MGVTRLVVPGMRALLQRLWIHLGEVVGPIRDVYRARSWTQRPAKIRTSPTRLLIIQRRTASCTSGSWVSRPTGVADGLSGPSAPELVAPEPEAGLPVRALGTWRHTRASRLWNGDPRQIREICQEGRRKGVPSQRDDRLGFEVRVREGREVIHAEVPPRRGRLKDPRLNGNADLVRPRTEGRLNGLEHSGLEGALRLSGLVLCLSLLRGGLGLQEFWRGPPPAVFRGRGPSPNS